MKKLLLICMLVLSIFAAGYGKSSGKKGTVSPVKVETLKYHDGIIPPIKQEGENVLLNICTFCGVDSEGVHYSEADSELVAAMEALEHYVHFIKRSEISVITGGSMEQSVAISTHTSKDLLIETLKLSQETTVEGKYRISIMAETITISDCRNGDKIADYKDVLCDAEASKEDDYEDGIVANKSKLFCKCETLEEFYSLLKSNGLDLRPVKREIDKDGLSVMMFELRCDKKSTVKK